MDYAIYLQVEVRWGGLEGQVVDAFSAGKGFSSVSQSRLRQIGSQFAASLRSAVQDSDQEIANHLLEELRAILGRQGTGRIYTTEWRTNRITGKPFPIEIEREAHQASAPGEPPAPDTHNLQLSTSYEIRRGKGGTIILLGTPLDYGRHLEYGNENFEPRPWMRVLRDNLGRGKSAQGKGAATMVIAGFLRRRALGFMTRIFRSMI